MPTEPKTLKERAKHFARWRRRQMCNARRAAITAECHTEASITAVDVVFEQRARGGRYRRRDDPTYLEDVRDFTLVGEE